MSGPETIHASNHTPNPTQSRIRAAEERLARAIGRLEGALEKSASAFAAADPAQPDLAQPDPVLSAEVARLGAENDKLRALVGQAGERLDATIVRLKAHLAG